MGWSPQLWVFALLVMTMNMRVASGKVIFALHCLLNYLYSHFHTNPLDDRESTVPFKGYSEVIKPLQQCSIINALMLFHYLSYLQSHQSNPFPPPSKSTLPRLRFHLIILQRVQHNLIR
jgi:hypothetical protein